MISLSRGIDSCMTITTPRKDVCLVSNIFLKKFEPPELATHDSVALAGGSIESLAIRDRDPSAGVLDHSTALQESGRKCHGSARGANMVDRKS